MNFKLFVKILLLSLLVMLVTSPLRARPLGFPYSSLIGFVVFFCFSLFCFKRYGSKLPIWQILTALIIGQWIVEAPMRIVHFKDTLISLPDSLAHSLGIICGFLYWRLKNPLNLITALLGCLIAVFMFFQGYDYWLHKLNFGTFTGKVEAYALPAKFEGFDEQKNIIANENLSGKIILLDFWYTGCGVCFQKFPRVQAVYDKYKNDSSVAIFAVDKPVEEDQPNEAFEVIKKEGYSFPVVIAKDEELPEKFGVQGYPTTFVIDQKGMIVFKGDIEGAIKMVDNLKNN